MRFAASSNDGGKAEVDCAVLQLGAFPGGQSQAAVAPSAGGEYESADFKLEKVIDEGGKDKLDSVPQDVIDPHLFQGYNFSAAVDPNNLPGLVDLRFVFKEKGLASARIEVRQASTGVWHPFEIDVNSTDDQFINTVLDLTEALVTA